MRSAYGPICYSAVFVQCTDLRRRPDVADHRRVRGRLRRGERAQLSLQGQTKRLRGLIQLHRRCKKGWLPQRQEMAAEKETPSGAGKKAWLERILGLSERNYFAFLPMRFKRGKILWPAMLYLFYFLPMTFSK